MSDFEMRKLLRQVMADIKARQAPRRRLLKGRLGPWLAPPLLAASLGLAGCGQMPVGSNSDATVATDAQSEDAAQAAYMAPFDAALDAEVDAEVDTGVMPPYMAPPFDAGPEPDYASPFDAAVEEDAGNIPLYMGPPPQDD
jgi:hypothetical protein